jgi:DNA-binding response OmpR family regulator
MPHETVLVVDDEPAIVQVIRERLLQEGFQVRAAGTGQAALAAVQEPPDLLILDLMLPDLDGLEVLRRLRQGGQHLPVIVLTARDDDIDVVVGLELGADDYVVKPFNPRELVARVRAVLRRTTPLVTPEAGPTSIPAGKGHASEVPPTGLYLEPFARRAWFQGQLLDLRPREYDLLYFLAQHPDRVLSRDTLLEQVWGTAEYIDDRTIDVHVHRLRQKLAEIDPAAEPIQTERGIGYRLEL